MQKVRNEWLDLNRQKIENLKKELVVMTFKHEHEEVPLKQIIQFIDGAIMEIYKLQMAKDKLETAASELKKE